MTVLILVRHGESEWNALQKLAGQQDVALTQLGKQQAREAATTFSGLPIDVAYTSELRRAIQTLAEIQKSRGGAPIPTTAHPSLNERNFGTLTGKIKADSQQELGMERYTAIMQGWDVLAPSGESLKMVSERVVPYFVQTILPGIANGKNTLIVAHHHVLKTIIKHLENLPDASMADLQLRNAEAVIYSLNAQGKILNKTL